MGREAGVRIIASLILGLSACATPPDAGIRDRPPEHQADGEDAWSYAIDRVTPHVTLIYRPDPFRIPVEGNVTVIEQSDGLVVVDAGGAPGAGARIVARIREISDRPVRAVVLTHWHGDHNYGLPAFVEAWPDAEIIATEATLAAMRGPGREQVDDLHANLIAFRESIDALLEGGVTRAGQPLEDWQIEHFSAVAADLAAITPLAEGARLIEPTWTFTDTLVLDDAETPIELRFIGRANTDGDAVVLVPSERVVISGDIVVMPQPFGFGSFPGAWIETLDALAGLDWEYLIPGHGPVQTDDAYLQRLTALLEEVRAQAAIFAAAGLSVDEARAHIDLSAAEAGFTGGDPWRAFWFQRWFTTPIMLSAMREATGEAIVQGQQ